MRGMKATLAATVLVVTALASPSVFADERGGRYIPSAGITIWCAAGNHNLAPIGEPEDYSSPLGWLFSGEPECAFADAFNEVREAQGEERVEWGAGGFAWVLYPEDFGQSVIVSTNDDVTGPDNTYLAVSWPGFFDDSVAGCGPQTIQLGEPGVNPIYLMWAFIDVVGIEDDLNVCLGTTGSITASFSG